MLQLKLLVAQTTTPEQRTKLVEQIVLLHPKQTAEDVAILVWDGKTVPHEAAERDVRLYAASDVSPQGPEAARDWQRHWRVVPNSRVRGTLQRAGKRWTPMFVCIKSTNMAPNSM